MYKTFDPLTYKLADLMVSATGSIPADRFAGGKVTEGVFTGLLRTIQATKATHRVVFKL